MTLFYPYGVDIDGTMIDGVSEQAIDTGAQELRPDHDGAADGRLVVIAGFDPVINITTMAVNSLLAALGASPLYGKALDVTIPATLFCQAGTAGGARASTGALKVVANAGIVIPLSLSAGNRTAASLQFQIVPSYDGTNAPLTVTAAQALAGTPAADEVYFAGPAKLNNTAMTSVKSLSINFGITLDKSDHAGYPYYSFVCVRSVRPVITITTDQVDLAATYHGGVAIASATHVYLRQGAAAGGRVADGTSQPKFTVNAGLIVSRAISGSPQQMAIDIIPRYDGTNQMIAYSSAAIT